MFLLLGVCLAMVAFGLGSALGSLVAWALSPWADSPRSPARTRARLLFWLRLLPTISGLAIMGLVFLPAWLAFEPRDTRESLPIAVAVAAAGTAALLLLGLGRGARAWWSTRRLSREWQGQGQPIDLPGLRVPAYRIAHPFPVVALLGILRPRLFVAEQVLEACEGHELDAILAHERAHLASGDNLKALVLRSCGDVLALAGAGRLERAWSKACEHAADAVAARSSALPEDLASALLKVARLSDLRSLPLPASALHEGGDVAYRVQRLLGVTAAVSSPSILAAWLGLLTIPASAAVAVLHVPALRGVHSLVEQVLRWSF